MNLIALFVRGGRREEEEEEGGETRRDYVADRMIRSLDSSRSFSIILASFARSATCRRAR